MNSIMSDESCGMTPHPATIDRRDRHNWEFAIQDMHSQDQGFGKGLDSTGVRVALLSLFTWHAINVETEENPEFELTYQGCVPMVFMLAAMGADDAGTKPIKLLHPTAHHVEQLRTGHMLLNPIRVPLAFFVRTLNAYRATLGADDAHRNVPASKAFVFVERGVANFVA
jgi:hypothetical protein